MSTFAIVALPYTLYMASTPINPRWVSTTPILRTAMADRVRPVLRPAMKLAAVGVPAVWGRDDG